jgi:hypothetical protein
VRLVCLCLSASVCICLCMFCVCVCVCVCVRLRLRVCVAALLFHHYVRCSHWCPLHHGLWSDGTGSAQYIPYKSLYRCLTQIVNEMEAGRMGSAVAAGKPRGTLDIAGLGPAHCPRSFIQMPVGVAAGGLVWNAQSCMCIDREGGGGGGGGVRRVEVEECHRRRAC